MDPNPASSKRASGPMRVHAPRRTDDVGGTLRDAFQQDRRMPDDLSRLLNRLTHVG